MKNSGRFHLDEVNYDKVYWKKTISFPDTYGKYNLKIVELNEKLYIFIEDRYPYHFYNGRTGPFTTFEEARDALEEDLGSNFPSIKNKTTKTGKVLLMILFWIIYVVLNSVLFLFIDGGLNAIGISDDSYMINSLTIVILNVIAINRIAKLRI